MLAWFIFGAIGFSKAVTSYQWPTTTGTVVSAKIIKPTGKSIKYVAEIGYSYQIENKNKPSDGSLTTSP